MKLTLTCLALVYAHVVWTEADLLDDSLTFAPSFTHQVFGEREVIFGYRNLKIKVHVHVCVHARACATAVRVYRCRILLKPAHAHVHVCI